MRSKCDFLSLFFSFIVLCVGNFCICLTPRNNNKILFTVESPISATASGKWKELYVTTKNAKVVTFTIASGEICQTWEWCTDLSCLERAFGLDTYEDDIWILDRKNKKILVCIQLRPKIERENLRESFKIFCFNGIEFTERHY